MGVDTTLFVGEVPRQLICSICGDVLHNPVQTPCEHLFCEEELLEWMLRGDVCPLDRTPLDADLIKPPNRIIASLLADLKRVCDNKDAGCDWVGSQGDFPTHLKSCPHVSVATLRREVEARDKVIGDLQAKVKKQDAMLTELASKLESRTIELTEALTAMATLSAKSPERSPKRVGGNPRLRSMMSPSSRSRGSSAPVSELQAVAMGAFSLSPLAGRVRPSP